MTGENLLGLQSQCNDPSHHGGGDRGAGVAIGAALPEVRGHLMGREEEEENKVTQPTGHHHRGLHDNA